MNELDLQTWFKKNNIPTKWIEEEKITLIQNNEEWRLNFPVFNKKGELNNYQIPIDENGVKDKNYNPDYISKSNVLQVFQMEGSNSESLGLNNKIKENKNIFLTVSPLDRLFLLNLGEKNVINIPPIIFSDRSEESNFFELFDKHIDLKNHEKVIICFPDNIYKEKYEEIVSNRIDKEKLYKSNFHFLKEINLYDNEISLFQFFKLFKSDNNPKDFISPEYFIKELTDNSKPFPIKGIYNFVDFESGVDSIYKNGLKKGESTGWDNVDNLYRPKTKHITVVYGIPEHGKSTFVKCLSLNLAKTANWKTAFFSFEDEGGESFYHEMIEKMLGENTPFHGTTKRTKEILIEDRYLKAKKFVQNYIKLIFPDNSEYGSEDFLDKLLDLFAKAVTIYGIKNIVLDPWNQIIQNRPEHLTEADFLSFSLGKINQFAKKYDVHVIIVAHPKIMPKQDNEQDYKIPTLYDISGGANWYNKTSVGICIYRKASSIANGLERITEIHVQKRKKRDLGRLGVTYLATSDNSEFLMDIVDCNKYEGYKNSPTKNKTKVHFLDFIKNNNSIKKISSNTKVIEMSEDTSPFATAKDLNKNNKNNSDLPF